MMAEERIGYIRVINGNEFPVLGRYNGKDYKFLPDVPLDVPELVAMHIFDLGRDDKSTALARLGWARTSDELEAGMKKLNKISFEEPPEMVEVVRPKKGKGKASPPPADEETRSAGPPATPGGTEGGGFASPPNGPKIGQDAAPAKEVGDGDTF